MKAEEMSVEDLPQGEREAIEGLKAKHGEIHRFEASGYAVYCRKPKRAEYKRFRSKLFDDKKRPEAIEELFSICVVYPEAPKVEAMLDDLPALAEVFGEKVLSLAGAGRDVDSKKL